MKRTESGKKISKSKRSSTSRAKPVGVRGLTPSIRFAVCVNAGGYVDLEPLKVYRVRNDAQARAHGLIRVVDSSGEDYLYPADYFRPIQAPRTLFNIVKKFASRSV